MNGCKIMDERYPMLSKAEYDKLTPMMQQYFVIKSQYLDYVLFYRLGDFYEMFFDDAVKTSPILEITLTSRGTFGDEKIPMCGVPFHALDNYLKRAVDAGISVAICEQDTPEAGGRSIVSREVVNIITPGTVYNSDLLCKEDNNFIASVYKNPDGLFDFEYSDISTGQRRRTSVRLGDLKNEIKKVAPSEIIYFSDNIDAKLSVEIGVSTDLCKIQSFDKNPLEMLKNYILYTAKRSTEHLRDAEQYSVAENLVIDGGSIRNLELIENLNTRKRKGSLLGVIDYTKTAMGARLLKESIKAPLLDIGAIIKRQDYVEFLTVNYWDRSNNRALLGRISDIERIVARLVYDTINYRDLVSIKNSLIAIGELKRASQDFHFFDGLMPLDEISTLIELAVDETGEGVRHGYSAELDEQRELLSGGKKFILDLEAAEKEATGIRTLRISYNKVFGYFIEVSKSFVDRVPERYIRRQTLVNSERYITEELKELEDKVMSASERAASIEKAIFENIKNRLRGVIAELQQNAACIAEIDMLTSFAECAYVRGYTRPKVDEGSALSIVGGRHAVIETISEYIPNDAVMNDSGEKIFILTGPNMAGKSSYLRQNAIIIILAQMGSFVPADSAHIGVVDRIFTRVGASDDLSEGRSTFMVEMKELAYILENITDRSFVILDEIGRGTSTYDGLSIALAVVEYLARRGAKVMFATHYHELTVLEGRIAGVLNYRILVKKDGDDIVFLRKIARGGESRSYGIEVARLAGVADEVVARARAVLRELETRESGVLDMYYNGESTGGELADIDVIDGLSSGEGTDDTELRSKLSAIDIDSISPREAWEILRELVEESK